jgi:hypothetical protein
MTHLNHFDPASFHRAHAAEDDLCDAAVAEPFVQIGASECAPPAMSSIVGSRSESDSVVPEDLDGSRANAVESQECALARPLEVLAGPEARRVKGKDKGVTSSTCLASSLLVA